MKLVPAEGLDSTRKALQTVTSVHVYSVQAASPSLPVDFSAQVWRTNAAYEFEYCKGLFYVVLRIINHCGLKCKDR